MLTVSMKDGSFREYMPEQYTDYDWRPEAFIVIKGKQWVGIYNWDSVKEVFFVDMKDIKK